MMQAMISPPPEQQPQQRVIRLEVIDRFRHEGGSTEKGGKGGSGETGGLLGDLLAGGGRAVGKGEQLKVVHILVNESGVEIIDEGHPMLEKSLSNDSLTKLPLHLVRGQQTSDFTSNGLATTSTISDKDEKKDISGLQARKQPSAAAAKGSDAVSSVGGSRNLLLLDPIEVSLQLGQDLIGGINNSKIVASEELLEEKAKEVAIDDEPLFRPRGIEAVESGVQTENLTEARHAEVQTEPSQLVGGNFIDGLAADFDGNAADEAVGGSVRPVVSVQETSSQTEPLEESTRRPSPSEAAPEAEAAEKRPLSEADLATSETQTTSVEQFDFSSQTDIEQPLAASINTTEAVTQTEVSEELVFEDQFAEEPQEVELETSQLPQRPLTFPGSSIDLLDDHTYTSGIHTTRTRTVSPTNLKVQDDVVARVLLEHLGTVFPDSNPRSAPVNYLDLSRLGEEGETPCSDEIWLAVEGSGPSDVEDIHDEDKFLTTDDTETYSVYTDRMADVGGNGGGGTTETMLAPPSANLLGSESELDRIGSAGSFNDEAIATQRLQGVLASELNPLHTTIKATDSNVVTLNTRFGNMESLIGTLCSTVETLSGMSAASGGGGGTGLRRASGTPDLSNVKEGDGAKSKEMTAQDMKKPDIVLLDQLVSRIEHLSSDVANMDNTRQLREDNLILRKELQTYREREVQMMTRLESLERSLNNIGSHPGGGGGERDRGDHGYRSSRRRRSSVGSNRSTPELPPIEQPSRSKSIDPPRASDQVEKPPKLATIPIDPAGGTSGGSGSESEQVAKGGSKNLDKIVKPPLMQNGASGNGSSKSNKKALLRRASNGSSSSSGNELDVKTIQKRKPITPTLEIDYLETEIQTVRSDNSILRQDIQVYRDREHQLYRRNQELQNEIISISQRNTPVGNSKSEMNISVDFVNDERTGTPKAVFEAKKGQSKKKQVTESESESDAVAKPVVKKEASKENLAVPKSKNGKKKTPSVSSSSSDESAKKVQIQDDPPKAKDETTKAATGVPKTKTTANGKNGKNGKKSKTSSSSDSDGGKAGKLVDNDEWKVTVTSAHELETTSDSESKTVVVKPKPQEAIKEEVKTAAKKEVKKAAKKAKVEKKKDKDPIPKPPMFPAPRPPRGYVPPRNIPNASYGVSNVFGAGGGSTAMVPLGSRPGTGHGASDNEMTHQMLFKQEARDSLVDASPLPPRTPCPAAPGPLLTDIPYPLTPTRQLPHPPICQVSYDSVFEDPYYCMSYY